MMDVSIALDIKYGYMAEYIAGYIAGYIAAGVRKSKSEAKRSAIVFGYIAVFDKVIVFGKVADI